VILTPSTGTPSGSRKIATITPFSAKVAGANGGFAVSVHICAVAWVVEYARVCVRRSPESAKNAIPVVA